MNSLFVAKGQTIAVTLGYALAMAFGVSLLYVIESGFGVPGIVAFAILGSPRAYSASPWKNGSARSRSLRLPVHRAATFAGGLCARRRSQRLLALSRAASLPLRFGA